MKILSLPIWVIILYNLGFPCGSAGKESTCNVGDLDLIPGLERFPGEGKSHPLQYPGLKKSMECIVHRVAKSQTQLSDFHFTSLHNYGFPGGSAGKESASNAGDLGLIPGLGRSPGEGNSYPFQYSGLENSTDRGTWWAIILGVTKSWTQLSDFHYMIIRELTGSEFLYCLTTSLQNGTLTNMILTYSQNYN